MEFDETPGRKESKEEATQTPEYNPLEDILALNRFPAFRSSILALSEEVFNGSVFYSFFRFLRANLRLG